MRAHSPIAAVLAASLIAAACGETSNPVAPRPGVSFGKGGPTPSGPNALPQRGRIVFQAWDGLSDHDLYGINEDGSGLTRLTYSAFDDRWPAGSRDGKKIAYVAEREDGTADVVVMNADGSQPKTITHISVAPIAFSRMDWSPDGKQIAIALNPSGDLVEWDIYLINASNGAMTQVTSFAGREMFPSWSPDGSRLAFDMADANGVKQVFTMKPDGSDITQFTYCAADCVQPAWSPDGKTIAHYDAAAQRTFVRSVSDWTIASGWFAGDFATWAPDAARLVFQNLEPAQLGTLATVSYAGSGVEQVVGGPGVLDIATWLRK